MTRPTNLTMSFDIYPYRKTFLDLVPQARSYTNTAEFAEQILTVILREQYGLVLELDIEPVEYHQYSLQLKYAVNRTTALRSNWAAMRRTFITDPDYVIHDLYYRLADGRFIIMGTFEH